MARAGWIVCWLLGMSACDGCAEEAETTRTQPTVVAETPVTTEEPVVSDPPTAESEPEEVAAPVLRPPDEATQRAIATATEALREGRTRARTEDWDLAIESFERSVAAADSARARCELGWAVYQLAIPERRTEAREHLQRGVDMLRMRARTRPDAAATLGACLYNLGRVAEETDSVAASSYYRESLSVRPGNRTVQSRLDALGADERPVPAPDGACGPRACIGPVPGETEAALTAAVSRHYEVDTAWIDVLQWSEDGQSSAPPAADADAFVFNAQVEQERYPSDRWLAMRNDAGWHACFIGPGDSMEDLTPVVARRQWIAGGPPEVDFVRTFSMYGHEDGIGSGMTHAYRWFAGFTSDGGAVVYGHVLLHDSYFDGDWGDCEEGCDGPEPECCELVEEGYSRRWRIHSVGSGRIRVERVHGDEGPASREVELSQLFCEDDD